MLFPSFAFLVFLPLVYWLYWYVFPSRLRVQNAFMLLASFVFYGWWDWRFLSLLIFSSFADFFIGWALANTTTASKRKAYVWLSLVINLGLLATFKYFNFFVDGLSDILLTFGMQPDFPTVGILLPIGISFYTFQSLSYSIDVYRGQIKPTHNGVAFLAFVSFFPQLVAGPIERAASLLPQFLAPRTFDVEQAKDGLRQMLWGFFKKIVVADGCASIVNGIFEGDVQQTPGVTLFFGAFFFAFQIYGDFSGYSDIAIGCARLFGFKLSRNFAYPYFSRNITEFWRRWHISLSTWFRDYVYVPLGGWRTKTGRFRNIMITFGVSGLWHGANWTFVTWGILHGLYYIPDIFRNAKASRNEPTLKDWPQMVTTFLLVLVAWVFFRSSSVHTAVAYLYYSVANITMSPGAVLVWTFRSEMAWILLMLVVEWFARKQEHALQVMPAAMALRWAIYLLITIEIMLHTDLQTSHEFIYFQF